MGDELFTITKENLESGLRGVPVGYCTTSQVDPQKGISYCEHPIESLAFWEPEKVIYLLYHGEEPSEEQLNSFKGDLQKRSNCSPQTIKGILNLPRAGHPMKLFCASILIDGMYDINGNYREDCLNIIARIPEITAAVIRHHAGWGAPIPSKPELGYMENFVQMLSPPNTDLKKLGNVMKLFNILHYDHGGGNLSTFVGKAIASGLEDMYGSLSGAMCALAGPRHGKANQDALEFVQKVLYESNGDATPEVISQILDNKLMNKKLVFGFGHAVLRQEDPRAAIFFEFAEKNFKDFPLYKICKMIRQVGPDLLKKHSNAADPYPNVDLISGTILTAAGFPYPEYFTVLFGLARIVGIAIQIVYERCEAKGGKGTPIIRPKYVYKPHGT